MKMRTIDILALQLNANRKEGHEVTHYDSILHNPTNVLKSIDRLEKDGLLKREISLENSLPRMLKSDLESILQKANLKKSGNKPALVERIIENIDYINDQNINIDLPIIYLPTKEGVNIMEEEAYIKHFATSFSSVVSFRRAEAIILESMEKHIEDKIEYIYLFEIERLYNDMPIPTKHTDISHNIQYYFSELAGYYHNNYDYDKARKFYHLSTYLSTIFFEQYQLKNGYSWYYDREGNLKEDRVKSSLLSAELGTKKIYEQLIYIENLSNDEIFKLFIDDVKEYYTPDEKFSKFFVDGIISDIKGENAEEIYSNFKRLIETEYPYKEPEYDSSNNENDYTIIETNLKTLLEHDVNINVEIFQETGEVYMYIDESERSKIFNSEIIEDLTESDN